MRTASLILGKKKQFLESDLLFQLENTEVCLLK